MTLLPETIDFNDSDFPALASVFRDIDLAIAALVASDPGFQPKRAAARRVQKPAVRTGAPARSRRPRRKAAA